MGAWEKLQLGWLDYETVAPSDDTTVDLGPHEYNSAKAQAAVVVLPKRPQTTTLVTPYAGQKSWWSGTGNDYAASMTRTGKIPAAAKLTFQANYSIEDGYDYAYVEVNDGTGWVSVPGTGTDPTVNNGITGDTGGKWVPMTFDLSSFAGKNVTFRFRYRTDGGVQGNGNGSAPGLFLDAITLKSGSTTVFSDGAETSPNGWTLSKFKSVGSSISGVYDNYYIASNRTYTSFDKYLQSGPYNFGFYAKPDQVEHFPYQNGLLVSYWNTYQSDNNTSEHPGAGLILPVDANPKAIVRMDGGRWRSAVSGYDAPFGLEKSDSFTLHQPIGPDVPDQANYIRGQAAQPLFHDDKVYYDTDQPGSSVLVPNNGTNIRVLSQSGTSMKIRVWDRN
jgi:immune inhibitor A